MENDNNLFSIRIFVADFYINKPLKDLDICYSNSRGREINSVPVIRIFGSDKKGEKICMHVHGVFPYFYIPYENEDIKNFEKNCHIMAASLDKAINIALGKSNSLNHHVFKIEIVEGIPFYGYHRKEHYFMKIYLYNPKFIKTAANLFQGGAILGKIYQPYESHINFILQFCIDYNLYGMSFLHVPKSIVKYRRKDNNESLENQPINQILDENIDRISTSKHEVDISATFILNRFLYTSEASHSNPGIHALWKDEKVRREKLMFTKDHPLVNVCTPNRLNVHSTDSHKHYKNTLQHILESKLTNQTDILNITMDSTINTSNFIESRDHSIYPAECSNKSKEIVKASLVEDHLVSRIICFESTKTDQMSQTKEIDRTVNEELILSLSQKSLNETLQQEDIDLLEIMKQLENDEEEIDLDSTLAPLTQPLKHDKMINLREHKNNYSQEDNKNANDTFSDSDEEVFNDLLMSTDDFEKNLSQSISLVSDKIPQLDGASDYPTTPTKNKKLTTNKTVSVRTQSKYTPLDISIKRSPKSMTSSKKSVEKYSSRSFSQQESCDKLTHNLKRRRIDFEEQERLHKKRKDADMNLDDNKSFISCNYRKSRKRNKKLHLEAIDDHCEVKVINEPLKKLSQTLVKNLKVSKEKAVKEISCNDKPIERQNKISSFSSDVANKNDCKYNYFPEAGPSGINFSKSICIDPSDEKATEIKTPDKAENNELNEELNICSFYDTSYIVESPSVFSNCSPTTYQNPSSTEDLNNTTSKVHPIIPKVNSVIITPKLSPPSYQSAQKFCDEHKIPKINYQEPFYGDYRDVTSKKEIGHNTLYIPGNSLNDVSDFQSQITDLCGIYKWRENVLKSLIGQDMMKTFNTNNKIKEYFASQRKVIIAPQKPPPTYSDAKLWIELRSKNSSNINKNNLLDDSPIKVKCEKIKMTLNEEPCEISSNQDPLKTTELEKSCLKATPPLMKKKRKKIYRSKKSLSNKFNQISTCENTPSSTSGVVSEQNESMKSTLNKCSFMDNLNLNEEKLNYSFRLSSLTLNNSFGFKCNLDNLQNVKADNEFTFLTLLCIEVFVPTRGELKPNPQYDPIKGLFYSLKNYMPESSGLPIKKCGIILVDSEEPCYTIDVEVIKVISELQLFSKLLEICQNWDPDIFVGYEIEMNSWGYIIDRARFLELNLLSLLSRIPSQKIYNEEIDRVTELDLELKLCGRVLLDVWRLLRSEIALTSYTFESVFYHILHKRLAFHSFRDLTLWYNSLHTRWIVLEYFLLRINGTIDLLDHLDLIGRTSEMAKIIGIQFYEVLSRGSQFRVESMMLRVAKPKNFVILSPSVKQRVHMRAPEYLPLILEPQSRFYVDPVIVLDFQSLYPSMIIAYNYCFSTCIGRVENLGQSIPFEFGAAQLRVPIKELYRLKTDDLLSFSPCGAAFVTKNVREGTLPRLLKEILDTRKMIKESMKIHTTDNSLKKILHSRQLALKLMANVTYGYTAANFSGRMPCVEVADSVVSKGRETLERAIKLVESNEQWKAKVVYGDTDSLFILLPGRTRTEAFQIGSEIAEAVTNDNPQPVKLKFEKIYQPCILQTKKRYVGYMYETTDQVDPIYEAKGIETVRRDGCPAVGRILEKCLRILFETRDVSKIKQYVLRQFNNLLTGQTNVQDLIFAKEFRGKNGYKPTACVPALELTRKWIKIDPRSEPRKGERVPFLIINGPPGVPLIKLVRSPYEFLSDEGLKINSIYYISKAIIPPLNRCLLLIGADVNEWFAELPRKNPFLVDDIIDDNHMNSIKKSTISQYFNCIDCVGDCGRQAKELICTDCIKNPMKTVNILCTKITKLERQYFLAEKICQSCCGRQFCTDCVSLDCPVLFVLTSKKRAIRNSNKLRTILSKHF